MSSEDWRSIPCSNYSISSRGRVRNDRNGSILGGSLDKDGYPRVSIRINDARKTVKIHRLVAFAFLDSPPPDKPHVAHKDGNAANNNVSNLRWSDVTENNRDKALHGTQTRGEAQHLAKLLPDDVKTIRFMADTGVSQRAIARSFGISKGNVQFIVHGKTWKHVA